MSEESKNDVVKEARELLAGITPWPWRLASFGDRPEIEGDFPSGDSKYPCRQILTMGFPHVDWTTFDPVVQQEFKRDAALITRAPELLSALCDEVERLRNQQDRESTCVVCSALLLTTQEPPHCLDCYVTDEDRERWEAEGGTN